MNDKITLEQKKAYYDSVKASNYQASLRLEGFDAEEIDLLTVCGQFNKEDCISSSELCELLNLKEKDGETND